MSRDAAPQDSEPFFGSTCPGRHAARRVGSRQVEIQCVLARAGDLHGGSAQSEGSKSAVTHFLVRPVEDPDVGHIRNERAKISDEVADVLQYLLQIADHTQVDLKRAVGRKLVKNAKKHLPLRTGRPAGTASASTIETHVLVDWENVQPKEGEALVNAMAIGVQQSRLTAAWRPFGVLARPQEVAHRLLAPTPI